MLGWVQEWGARGLGPRVCSIPKSESLQPQSISLSTSVPQAVTGRTSCSPPGLCAYCVGGK